jgi:hypothetical protein
MAMAALSIASAGPASAQVVKSRDLASVAEASKQNEARFERDYKGRTFEDRISFAGMEKPMFGGVGYDVRLGTSGFLHAAQCRISDQATIDFLTDRNLGDLLAVRGVVERTIMGVVMMENCTIR